MAKPKPDPRPQAGGSYTRNSKTRKIERQAPAAEEQPTPEPATPEEGS